MLINKEKSGIMIISGSNKFSKFEKKNKLINGYPFVKEYKYLGVYVDKSLSLNSHLKNL